MITIRLFTDSDFDDFYAIRRESLATAPDAFISKIEDFDREDPEIERQRYLSSTAASNPNRMIVGAWIDDQIKGTMGMARFGHAGFEHQMVIWGVFVSLTARGLGLAEAMMHHLFEEGAKVAGVKELVLGVMQSNTGAIRFYEKVGMQPFTPAANSPLLEDAILEEEIFMIYRLDI